MKDLLRIMIFLSIVLIGLFYLDPSINENDVLEAPRTTDPLPSEEITDESLDIARPATGISSYIGKASERWIEQFGEPGRIEPSAFGYDWWVYNDSYAHFTMVGVKDDKIVQVYTAGTAADATPYKIGQSLDELYRFTILENEVTVKYGDNSYTFNVTAEDMDKRILVKFEGVYAQLYIDSIDRALEAVRFMDAETLVRHQPYDMMFSGELLPIQTPSSTMQQSIDDANAKQIVDLVNVYRLHHQTKPLIADPLANMVAETNSEDMAKQNFSSEELEFKDLHARLEEGNIDFEQAAVNTAARYFDAAETVHGWTNSDVHRKTLLSNQYNQTGVGVFGKYYTQIFLETKPVIAQKQ
ncbi:CAP domain-containing protein [uncultured Planococcus sp.]|uniref:CAP domain-containing protein n=1 Tax=Planococcus donghaensis TaxID=414778 RepID=UPI002607EB23|nr:CAP-associated domain-containing protein [uncultured Planococcus sp.]